MKKQTDHLYECVISLEEELFIKFAKNLLTKNEIYRVGHGNLPHFKRLVEKLYEIRKKECIARKVTSCSFVKLCFKHDIDQMMTLAGTTHMEHFMEISHEFLECCRGYLNDSAIFRSSRVLG